MQKPLLNILYKLKMPTDSTDPAYQSTCFGEQDNKLYTKDNNYVFVLVTYSFTSEFGNNMFLSIDYKAYTKVTETINGIEQSKVVETYLDEAIYVDLFDEECYARIRCRDRDLADEGLELLDTPDNKFDIVEFINNVSEHELSLSILIKIREDIIDSIYERKTAWTLSITENFESYLN